MLIKRYHGVLLLTTVAVTTALSIQKNASNRNPQIHVESRLFDFGSRDANQLVKHTFYIRNRGRATLLVEGLEKSCGCIEKVYLRSRSIEPGGVQPLSISFHTPRTAKSMSEDITVRTNDPRHPTTHLMLQGTVTPALDVYPGAISFGLLGESRLPSVRTVRLQSSSYQASQKIDIVDDMQMVNYQIRKVGSNKWDLTAAIPRNCPSGPIVSELNMKPNWASPRRLRVLGEVLGPVTAKPNEIYLERDVSNQASQLSKVIKFVSTSEPIDSVRIAEISRAVKPYLSCNVLKKAESFSLNVDLRDMRKAVSRVNGYIKIDVTAAGKDVRPIVVPVSF